jgi:hypothetical protein
VSGAILRLLMCILLKPFDIARVDTLTKNLITRIRPFVEAKHPGDANDPETVAFENKTRLEAEDLKLESFGVELLHTIGNVYIQKSTTFVRSKKFLGGGFFSRLKEKGSMLKEGWGVLGSAIGVQMAMEEMAKMEAKGDASQEELEAMAADLSSKVGITEVAERASGADHSLPHDSFC